VQYRVGQVIRHKKWGYLGVIVGWDSTAKAPEDWLQTMHGSNDVSSKTTNE
jgi:hemimethylated DNA binding protein